MKRYFVTLVLFLGALTSGAAYADNWTPGTPKPPAPVPETWLTDLTGLFSDLWSYLTF